MANYRKSFNFRNGVQVDNDNFIVNANGLVGIGTSIPTESLDVIGNVKITGFTTATTLGVGQTATFSGDVEVGSSISFDPVSGDVTATRFVGDASGLTNIFAISTTGWVAQGVGLHTFRSIGIGTTNPLYSLQVGENPVSSDGVSVTTGGDIRASGVVTATTFVGNVTGNVIGNVTGNVTGNSSSATALQNSRNFSITGDLEASAVSFNGTANVSLDSTLSSSFSANTSGIITASGFVGNLTSSSATITNGTITNANVTNANVGVGTFDSIRIDNTADSTLTITSNQTSIVSIGASVGAGNSSVELKYDASTGDFNISNYDLGDISLNLHEGTGAGITGGFKVKYDNSNIINATYDGRVSINKNSPDSGYNVDINGDVKLNNSGIVVGILTVGTGINQITIGDGSYFPIDPTSNFNVNSGVSTFNNLEIIDSIKPTDIGTPLGIGLTPSGGNTIGVGSDFVIVSADVQIGSGYTASVHNLTVSNYIDIQTNTGVGGSISADIDNTINKTVLGVTTVSGILDVNYNNQSDILVDVGKILLNVDKGSFIGIGTTSIDNPEYNVAIYDNTFIEGEFSCTQRLGFTTNGIFKEDPRGNTPFYSPVFEYGDLQIDTTSASLIIDGNLCIVPGPGVSTVGFGSTNGGLIPNLATINDDRLTYVGINTFFPRSIFDVGTASTTTNSYFLPPSLSQAELNIVSNLWRNPSGFGTITARRVTPDGVPGGALVYNSTNTRLEVGIGSTTFCGIATLTNNHTGFEAFVPPKLTTAERNTMTAAGITSGGIIYNKSLSKLQFYNGSTWETITSS